MGYFDADAQEMLDVYLLETHQLIGQLADQLVCLQQVHIQHLLRIRVKIPHMLPLSDHHILIPDAAVLTVSFSPVKRFVRTVNTLLDPLLILVSV